MKKSSRGFATGSSLRRHGQRRRHATMGNELTDLAHQLALVRTAAERDAARHRDELLTMSQAYQVLYGEFVELKAQSEGAALLADERLFVLQSKLEASEALLSKLSAERDTYEKTARDAIESRAKMAGQLEAARAHLAELLSRVGGPSSKTNSRPAAPSPRAPLVPRVITTPRGSKKST